MWLALKSPEPPTEIAPGFAFAAAMKSSSVRYSLSAGTARMFGVDWKM